MKRQKSLLLRLLTIVTITILAPSILTFLVFFRTVPERMETQARANVGFYIDQTNASVKNSMELAREVAFSALGDPMLQKNMQRTEFYLSSMGRGALEQMVGSVTAYQSAWSRNVLSSIYLFRDDGQYTFYSAKGAYAQEQRRMENICNQSLELSSAKTLFQIPGAPENMVYFLLDYKNIDTMAHLGKLVMELDVSSMVNADGLMELYPGTCLILSNTDGEPLYTLGDEPETADRVIADSNMESFSRLGTGHSRDRYYHVSRQIQGCQMQMDVFVPAAAIYNQVWSTNLIFFVSCILILLLTTAAASLGYYLVMRPLRDMETALRRMAASDYTARMPCSNCRELAVLEEAFNAMADHLDAAFEETYQKGIALRESESRLLAAQINPHFLYNCLSSIKWKAIRSDQDDIAEITGLLATFYRTALNGGRQITIVQNELENIKAYLQIQLKSHENNFDVEYQLDEAGGECQMPNFLLQPIVENAICHGADLCESERGKIKIEYIYGEEFLEFHVYNNGPKVVGEELERILNTPGKGYGIYNIRERIRMYYDEECGLYSSTTDEGMVCFSIKIRKEIENK